MEFDFTKVDELIKNDIANGFPGAVLQISHKGKTIKHSAYGYKLRYDNEFNELPVPERMDLDTVFDLASNTKIFATTLISMVMAQKGLLDLDKPLTDFLPDYHTHDKITTRMLLSHCAGYGPEVWFFDYSNPLGKDFYSNDRELTKKLLIKTPLDYAPLSATVYSDTSFMLLGIVIEHILGQNISDAAKELVYNPFGLKMMTFQPLSNGINLNQIAATSIGNTCNNTMNYPNIRTDLIRGEVQDEKAYYSMGGIAGHAGLFSASSDLVKLCELIQNVYRQKGSFLSNRILREFISPIGTDDSFGCGWRVNTDGKVSHLFGNKASDLTIGHSGFTGTLTLIDLKNEISIVLLTNKIHSYCYDRKHYAGSDFYTGKYAPVIEEAYNSILN